MAERIVVIGLGYVGLPVGVGMARTFGSVVGFDIKAERVAQLQDGHDVTRKFAPDELAGLEVTFVAQWGLSVTCPNLCVLLIPAEFSR